jgi:hypothetical protein
MIIEQTIIEYLSSALTVPVYAEIPADPPDAFVLVEKTGGQTQNHLKSATLAVQSYSGTLYGAATLSASVCDALNRATELNAISHIETNDYNYTDTQSKRYRYQAVVDCVYFDD